MSKPVEGDFYLVAPFNEVEEAGMLEGAAQVFILEANSEEEAAQVAFDNGFERCFVILGRKYEP